MTIKKVPNLEDFQFQPSVKDKDLSSPPGSPSKGHRYIIADAGSGDWTGHTGDIAIYNGSTWDFVTKVEGFLVWVDDEDKFYKYTGAAWVVDVGPTGPTGPTGSAGATGATGPTGAAGGAINRATFTNASLSSGILTITHSAGLSAPYSLLVIIFDNNYKQIIPDNITGATNSVAIDLTSYGTLTGTWGYIYIV